MERFIAARPGIDISSGFKQQNDRAKESGT